MLRASKTLSNAAKRSWKRYEIRPLRTRSGSSSTGFVDYDPVTKKKFKAAISLAEDDEMEKKYKNNNEEIDDDNFGDEIEQFFGAKESISLKASKKILLKLGRTSYRHNEFLPSWFIDKQKEICQHRTVPQIRRCLKNWMVKYDHDLMVDYGVRKIGFRSENAHNLPVTSVKKIPKSFIYGPEETIAYAFYHMPSRFSIYNKLLNEIKTFLPNYQPDRILDFGCGPATFAAAVKTTYPDLPIQSYRGIDMSQSMIDAAKIMTKQRLPNATFYAQTGDFLKRFQSFPQERHNCVTINHTLTELGSDEMRKTVLQMCWEMVEPGGLLIITEAGNPQGSNLVRSARQYILDMMQTMDEKGKFKIYTPIGPAKHNPDQSATIRSDDLDALANESTTYMDGETRITIDQLDGEEFEEQGKKATQTRVETRKKARYGGWEEGEYDWREGTSMFPAISGVNEGSRSTPYNAFEAAVVAPCTHDRVCPLKSGVWCSFGQKVVSGTMRKDAEEKYSYVIIQKVSKATSTNGPNTNADDWVVANLHPKKEKKKIYQARYTPLDIATLLDEAERFRQQEEDENDDEDEEEEEEEKRKKKPVEDDDNSNDEDSEEDDDDEDEDDDEGANLPIPTMTPMQLLRAATPKPQSLPQPSSAATRRKRREDDEAEGGVNQERHFQHFLEQVRILLYTYSFCCMI